MPNILKSNIVNNQTEWPIGQTISLVFDTEVDEYSIRKALFITGPDHDIFIGPGMDYMLDTPYSRPELALQSPGYEGDVLIDIDVYRSDEDGNKLDVQACYGQDEVEYTRVNITPIQSYAVNTKYKLFITGSEENNYSSVNSRSVFDVLADGGNTGDGQINSSGVYFGDSDTVILEITESGNKNNVQFSWWLLSDVTHVRSDRSYGVDKELIDNVYISFLGDFEAGDVYQFNIEPATMLSDTIVVNFTTANELINELPDSVSRSPIENNIGPEGFNVVDFTVVKTSPKDNESNVNLSTRQVVITFNKELDSASHRNIKLSKESMESLDIVNVPFTIMVDGKKLYLNIMEH